MGLNQCAILNPISPIIIGMMKLSLGIISPIRVPLEMTRSVPPSNKKQSDAITTGAVILYVELFNFLKARASLMQ